MTASSHRAHAIALAAAAWMALAMPGALRAQAVADDRASYSYVRSLDGRAELSSDGRDSAVDAALNEPLLQGDLVTVERGARVEIALADRNLLRVAGGSAVRLTRVAFSADRDDRTTRLDLDDGEIFLSVGEEALGDELPEVRTPVATIYVHDPGGYRIVVDGDTVELVVREGFAEVLTDRGSTVVRAGESAWTNGDRDQRVELAEAGPEDALERWSGELESDAYAATSRELRVEPELAYAAAPLANYGNWVQVDTSWYWRPRVSIGWRPYWDGRWSWTPSGLTWVSYEPWGWVPYHYGSWTLLPHYGWVWRPGHVYSPAWVYWNVGPRWTGWCPVGYYTDFYRPYGYSGFHFGVYGWAGGSWGIYADWTFSPTVRVLSRDPRPWRHSGFQLARTEGGNLSPGVLTTDTAALPRERWNRPDDLVDTLAQRGRRGAGGPRELPEVSSFVARRRELPADVRQAVVDDGRGRTLRHDAPAAPGARGGGRRDVRVAEPSSRRRGGEELRSATAEPRERSRAPQAGLSSPAAPRSATGRGASSAAIADRGVRERRAVPSKPAAQGLDRQGWRSHDSRAPVASRPAVDSSARAAAAPSREPVQRVIGGLRRGSGAADAPARSRAEIESSPRLERGRSTPATPRARQIDSAPEIGNRGSGAQLSRPTAPRAGVPAPQHSTPPRATARPPRQQQAPSATARPPQQQQPPRATARPPQQQQPPRATARAPQQQAPRATAKPPQQQQQRGASGASKPAGGAAASKAKAPPARGRDQGSDPPGTDGSGHGGRGGKKGDRGG